MHDVSLISALLFCDKFALFLCNVTPLQKIHTKDIFLIAFISDHFPIGEMMMMTVQCHFICIFVFINTYSYRGAVQKSGCKVIFSSLLIKLEQTMARKNFLRWH